MKKVILMAAVICSAVLVSCSSKKCYTCTTNGTAIDFCEDNLTNAEIEQAEAACELGGGTWATK